MLHGQDRAPTVTETLAAAPRLALSSLALARIVAGPVTPGVQL
jgi:hypothetical protein